MYRRVMIVMLVWNGRIVCNVSLFYLGKGLSMQILHGYV